MLDFNPDLSTFPLMNDGQLKGSTPAKTKQKPSAHAGRKRRRAPGAGADSSLRFACLWLLGMAPYPVIKPQSKSKNHLS